MRSKVEILDRDELEEELYYFLTELDNYASPEAWEYIDKLSDKQLVETLNMFTSGTGTEYRLEKIK